MHARDAQKGVHISQSDMFAQMAREAFPAKCIAQPQICAGKVLPARTQLYNRAIMCCCVHQQTFYLS